MTGAASLPETDILTTVGLDGWDEIWSRFKVKFSQICWTFIIKIGREKKKRHYTFKSLTPKLSANLPSKVLRKKTKKWQPYYTKTLLPTVRETPDGTTGPLSIINSPLVVLSTRPMHILKKYPVNMLCIGLVRRLDKRNQHPSSLMWTSLPSVCTRLPPRVLSC